MSLRRYIDLVENATGDVAGLFRDRQRTHRLTKIGSLANRFGIHRVMQNDRLGRARPQNHGVWEVFVIKDDVPVAYMKMERQDMRATWRILDTAAETGHEDILDRLQAWLRAKNVTVIAGLHEGPSTKGR